MPVGPGANPKENRNNHFRGKSVSVAQTDRRTNERKPSLRDTSGSSFVFVRCTDRPTDRQTDGRTPSFRDKPQSSFVFVRFTDAHIHSYMDKMDTFLGPKSENQCEFSWL